jgi:hypothetical protein
VNGMRTVYLHTNHGAVAQRAQATVHPHLVIVPEIDLNDGDRFTGGFTIAHVPTGRVLDTLRRPSLVGRLTPEQAEIAAAWLAHLDWTSTARDDYQGEHKQAWLEVLDMLAELLADAEDHPWRVAEVYDEAADTARVHAAGGGVA